MRRDKQSADICVQVEVRAGDGCRAAAHGFAHLTADRTCEMDHVNVSSGKELLQHVS